LIPNLLKNINVASVNNHIKATINGLTILDNLSRVEEGKFALKKNNTVMEISKILENCDNEENVVQMAAKIFSKITNMDDMMNELKNVEKINLKQDYDDGITSLN
jgi:tRNA U55 pseudouridine synthase TruB